MLVGMDHMKKAPREQARGKGIVLYQSEFSTRHVARRDMNMVTRLKVAGDSDPRVLS
jgi:hypothetical protein